MQQNIDMRKISAWAGIVAVPTMVAGIYGMNFHFMPELNEKWGYPTVVGRDDRSSACVLYFQLPNNGSWL